MIALKCPICGAPVPPSKGVKPRMFCSHKCALKSKRKRTYVSLAQMQRDRANNESKARARLRARDADYAASPCAARVTVDCVRTTDGRTLVVETRGQRCIGWRSCGKVSHN